MDNHRKKDEITCVQLSKKTRDRLAELGTKKDTYEDIIQNLIGKSDSQNQDIDEVESDDE